MKEISLANKSYYVNPQGFLVNHKRWDDDFARQMASEIGIESGLTKKHWEVIHFLREYFDKNGVVPTVYECCEANQLELEDCERLFPDGYHRGALKIAGLRVR